MFEHFHKIDEIITYFQRIVDEFGEVNRFVILVQFLWGIVIICNTLLMLQMEMVKFIFKWFLIFLLNCENVSIKLIESTHWFIFRFISPSLKMKSIRLFWPWFLRWFFGHSPIYTCAVNAVNKSLLDLMSRIKPFTSWNGILIQRISKKYCTWLWLALKGQLLFKVLEIFHAFESKQKRWINLD